MRRRHFPRSEPPPVAELQRPRSLCLKCSWVPDVAHDKGERLSRAERRAREEGQRTLFLDGGPSQIESIEKEG